MKSPVLLVLLASLGSTLAKPSNFLGLPTLTYASLGSGAPVGPDGRVVDTPAVALAKIEHAAAQLNERRNLADEAARSGDSQVTSYLVPHIDGSLGRALTAQDLAGASLIRSGSSLNLSSLESDTPGAAPVGVDGRVVDTPAVARAKAEHAAAHLNEKYNLSNAAARNSGLIRLPSSSGVGLHL